MKLKEFVIEAKLAGHAGNIENQKLTFPDGSVGFKYNSEGFDCLDRYYGTNPHIPSAQLFVYINHYKAKE